MRKKTMLQSTDMSQLSIDMLCPGTPRNTLIVQLLPNLAIPLLIETFRISVSVLYVQRD
jgi:hypothetical protein